MSEQTRRRALTFVVVYASAAVLVVELTALRLLAPHLGLTLETSTLVIGIALAAIAAGSWAGGRLADRVPAAHLLTPALALSGVVVAATPAAIGWGAEVGGGTLLLTTVLTIGAPGALLSAVTPIVTTLRLQRLEETGAVVGSLSGVSSVGAIAGTVVTGFVLISRVPVSSILVGLGITLLVIALVIGSMSRTLLVRASVALVAAAVTSLAVDDGCEVETTYHCALVRDDAGDPTRKTLVLDGIEHSSVDVDDPTRLEFAYVRALGVVADQVASDADRQDPRVLHLGAGGMTLPRYLEARYPRSRSVVVDIDGGVVALNRTLLGPAPRARVVVDDARLHLSRARPGAVDLVVGDAFGGISPPWHLTTTEALTDIETALTPTGTYAANLIDYGPTRFARAEVATTASVFEHVAVVAEPATLDGRGADGGNLVVVASNSPLDVRALDAQADAFGWSALSEAETAAWSSDAPVLTDDYAPVDQLIGQDRTPSR